MDLVTSLMLSGIVIGCVLGALITYAIGMYIKRMYPISLPVVIQRGTGYVWDLGERGVMKKTPDGKEFVMLKNAKRKIKPPKYATVTTDKNGKPVYPIFNTTAGQYFPMKVKDNVSIESVEDKSSINWAIQQLAENDLRYMNKETLLDLIVKYVAPLSFAVMVVFFIIYFGGKIETASNSLSAASLTLAEAMMKLQGG